MPHPVTKKPVRFSWYWLVIGTVLMLVTLGSLYYSFLSDHKLARFLMAHDWTSFTVTHVSSNESPGLATLKQMTEKNNLIFMPNHTYSRVSRVSITNRDAARVHLTITEFGQWAVSGGYLQIRPIHFNEMKTGDETAFNTAQLATIRTYFQINAEQSNQIDILNQKSVLLTGLNTRSQVLNALP
ncbi:regulatory protein ToxS [Photobacterium sp. 1_MG-2023]|uniref:regulatory protein ToxS n=1 Tax=Photobacterium sp. 1_MG-2023 TaxID=3062646 RepID=UPI0026E39358|nr:regulatory protein ToxS [Photobacterium sp. 1_MG-2023]MDO6705048.1 regulatory protein ToxS [Photobacterium sp. 1_MG-2023]